MAEKLETPDNDDWIDKEIADNYKAAKARGDRYLAKHPRATMAWFESKDKRVFVSLSNGVDFSFPSELAQGLRGATNEALEVIEMTPFGTGLHWPLLDADLSVAGLLAGIFGTKMWMKEIAIMGGKATTKAKSAASRANGLKGGRPKKSVA
jgi:Protein of unknown function (DUF2442)